ncbi:MAG: hypothetical protein EA397_15020 [Deltaproteobacteria bacterium]|nr:MAG: hypothetical protein EA397_15020 [Deltaproteobacteria bacterium]
MPSSSDRSFGAACERLPVVLTLQGIPIRWLGPLVSAGYEADLELMSQAAWGYLEDCGWQEPLQDAGPLFDEDGEIRPAYARAFADAAERLAAAGGHAGPESEMIVWGAWLGTNLAQTCAVIRARTEALSES